MKATPTQRRRGPRVAVLALVLCPLLVPLAFLFDRVHSGYVTTDDRHRQEVVLPSFDRVERRGGAAAAVNGVSVDGVRQGAPKKISNGSSGVLHQHKQIDRHSSSVSAKPKVIPTPRTEPPKAVTELTRRTSEVSKDRKRQDKGAKADEVENAKACQLEFGSYCL